MAHGTMRQFTFEAMEQRTPVDLARLLHRVLRPSAAAWLSVLIVAALAAAQPGEPSKAQDTFLLGLRALHNFEYEEANEAFGQAERIDPGFVLAYWGEAMTYNQTLWRREDVDAAR